MPLITRGDHVPATHAGGEDGVYVWRRGYSILGVQIRVTDKPFHTRGVATGQNFDPFDLLLQSVFCLLFFNITIILPLEGEEEMFTVNQNQSNHSNQAQRPRDTVNQSKLKVNTCG